MRNIALDKAKNILAKRRNDALLRCEKVQEKLAENSDWAVCQKNIRVARLNLGLALGTEREKQLRKPLEELLVKESQLLAKYGYTKGDLEPKFYCTTCCDTGFVNGGKCSCLKAELT